MEDRIDERKKPNTKQREGSCPRILVAAPASGSGKTMLTCGMLRALQRMGKRPVSFKCGPDYIDPMFHSRVLGTKSRNLDTFFTPEETVLRRLLAENAAGADIAVLEGVMGYYDGIAGTTVRASTCDVARATGTPALLLVDARGASVSLIPLIQGFLNYRPQSAAEAPCGVRREAPAGRRAGCRETSRVIGAENRIGGVIFNRMSPMLYPRMKALAQRELSVPVLGYVPELAGCVFESRHLGLLLPEEIEDLQGKTDRIADTLLETLDWDGIFALAGTAEPLFAGGAAGEGETGRSASAAGAGNGSACRAFSAEKPDPARESALRAEPLRIGIARDEAFCFFYEDNFKLLREKGAELVFFSPLHDAALPEGLDGVIFCGGYPELHARQLGENASMCAAVRGALSGGLPCIAECGGFLYLHEQLEDMEGNAFSMAGVIPGRARRTEKLGRFGYITLKEGRAFGRDVGPIPSHEYHYFESENCGDAFLAQKPESGRSWRCMHSTDTLLAGFPHLYFYANPAVADAFLDACRGHKALI